MKLVCFDDRSWGDLLPLTYTRPASELRVGILKIREKWERRLQQKASWLCPEYLSELFPMEAKGDTLYINGSLLPDPELLKIVQDLSQGESIKSGEILLAFRDSAEVSVERLPKILTAAREYSSNVRAIRYPWNIFSQNGAEIENDFALITEGRTSEPLDSSIQSVASHKIFVEPGFRGNFVTLNAENGPIYLGAESEVMEGSVIRGPFSLGEHSTVKLGAKIYGPTTIGPHSKVGGEVNNAVFQGYSNKGHDGFLGNAVLGEWCNLGADTNNSNLKNNYTEVKVWNYPLGRFTKTGLQFCGLIMGDHSKCGINTMFNTGTVVGVSANIFGSGFPRNFIPSFSWGGAHGMTDYALEKALQTMELVLIRRGKELSEADQRLYSHIFQETARYRKW